MNDNRQKRLSEALRANLKRRKQQRVSFFRVHGVFGRPSHHVIRMCAQRTRRTYQLSA